MPNGVAVALILAICLALPSAHAEVRAQAGLMAESRCVAPFLTVTDRDAERVLYSSAVYRGADVHIAYTHSIDKTPVVESLKVSGKPSFFVHYVDYKWYGAGLETMGDYEARGDWVRVRVDRDLGSSFRLRVGSVADHRVTIADATIRLSDHADPFAEIEFTLTCNAPSNRQKN